MTQIYAAQIVISPTHFFSRAGFAGALLLALTACSTLSPPPPSAPQPVVNNDAAETALPSDGTVYSIQPNHSSIQMYAFRSGPGARFGHNHVLRLTQGTGTVWLPVQGIKGARADFTFRLDALEIDPPELRAELGGSFKQILKQSDIEGTREHMLGATGLDAASFPEVRVHGVVQSGEEPVAIALVSVKLHGVSRDQLTLIRFNKEDQHLRARGNLLVRHQDFGLKPYSVMGGLLAVDDWIAIEFDLQADAVNPNQQASQ